MRVGSHDGESPSSGLRTTRDGTYHTSSSPRLRNQAPSRAWKAPKRRSGRCGVIRPRAGLVRAVPPSGAWRVLSDPSTNVGGRGCWFYLHGQRKAKEKKKKTRWWSGAVGGGRGVRSGVARWMRVCARCDSRDKRVHAPDELLRPELFISGVRPDRSR